MVEGDCLRLVEYRRAGLRPSAIDGARLFFGTVYDTVAHVSLSLAVACFLLAIPYLTCSGNEEFVANVLPHGYVFVLLMAVTALGRTLPLEETIKSDRGVDRYILQNLDRVR